MMTLNTLIDALLDELRQALRSVNPDDVDRVKRRILGSHRVFIAGKGRSGLQMEAFAMRLMHLGLGVHVVGEVTAPAIASGDVLIIGSGSGRTPLLIGYAERATAVPTPIILITAAADSPLHSFADEIIRIDAPTPKLDANDRSQTSTLPMASLFEQALGLLLDVIILMLMRDLNSSSGQMFSRHANLE